MSCETEEDLEALRNALLDWMMSQDVQPADGVVAMVDLAAMVLGASIAGKGMPRSECFECWETLTRGGLERLLRYYDFSVEKRGDLAAR